jgi:hypothetical protein
MMLLLALLIAGTRRLQQAATLGALSATATVPFATVNASTAFQSTAAQLVPAQLAFDAMYVTPGALAPSVVVVSAVSQPVVVISSVSVSVAIAGFNWSRRALRPSCAQALCMIARDCYAVVVLLPGNICDLP